MSGIRISNNLGGNCFIFVVSKENGALSSQAAGNAVKYTDQETVAKTCLSNKEEMILSWINANQKKNI